MTSQQVSSILFLKY